MADARLLAWQIDATAGSDSARVRLEGTRLSAEGQASGQRPFPWSTTYALETGDDFVTARIRVEARWDGGGATLDLRRTAAGWTVNGEPRPDLAAALDCDLGACPLTNTMPVLRHGLLARPGDHELLMAFIDVPDLTVVPNVQRYTHVRRVRGGGALITYRSGSFRSDVTFDADGFVVDYPQLGRRIPAGGPTVEIRARGAGSVRPD
jgi:hypothetical protein